MKKHELTRIGKTVTATLAVLSLSSCLSPMIASASMPLPPSSSSGLPLGGPLQAPQQECKGGECPLTCQNGSCEGKKCEGKNCTGKDSESQREKRDTQDKGSPTDGILRLFMKLLEGMVSA